MSTHFLAKTLQHISNLSKNLRIAPCCTLRTDRGTEGISHSAGTSRHKKHASRFVSHFAYLRRCLNCRHYNKSNKMGRLITSRQEFEKWQSWPIWTFCSEICIERQGRTMGNLGKSVNKSRLDSWTFETQIQTGTKYYFARCSKSDLIHYCTCTTHIQLCLLIFSCRVATKLSQQLLSSHSDDLHKSVLKSLCYLQLSMIMVNTRQM